MKTICPSCKKAVQAFKVDRCSFCYAENKFKADYCPKCRYNHEPCYVEIVNTKTEV